PTGDVRSYPLNRSAAAAACLACITTLGSFVLSGPAQAASAPLPSTAPQSTAMVDTPGTNGGPNTVAIRTISQAGNVVWAGGVFDQIDDAGGNKVADANGLAAFDANTGALAMGVHIPLFGSSTSTPPEVYGSSRGPNGILYLS